MLQTTTNPKDPVHFDTLLKGDQVARILNVSRSYAFLLMQRDEIPTVRLGRAVRVRPSDLERFISKSINHTNE